MKPLDPRRCQQIAALLREIRPVIVQYSENDPNWSGLANSQLATERANARQEGGDNLLTALDQAITVTQIYVFAMAQHLDALAVLFDTDHPPLYSIGVLARTVVELGSRVWWITDPDLTMRVRVARGFAEKLSSLRDAAPKRLDGLEGGPSKLASADSQHSATLKPQMQALGISEERRPSATKLVGQLMERGISEKSGALYRILSANVHGTLWAVTMHFIPEDPSATQPVRANYQIDQELLDGPPNVAFLGTCWVVERIVELLDWPFQPVRGLLGAADRIFG